MREIEDIRADWDDARGRTPCMAGRIIAAEQRLIKDIPDLLAEIERLKSYAAVDAERIETLYTVIDRCNADLAQAQSATGKLSKGLWKDC